MTTPALAAQPAVEPRPWAREEPTILAVARREGDPRWTLFLWRCRADDGRPVYRADGDDGTFFTRLTYADALLELVRRGWLFTLASTL